MISMYESPVGVFLFNDRKDYGTSEVFRIPIIETTEYAGKQPVTITHRIREVGERIDMYFIPAKYPEVGFTIKRMKELSVTHPHGFKIIPELPSFNPNATGVINKLLSGELPLVYIPTPPKFLEGPVYNKLFEKVRLV